MKDHVEKQSNTDTVKKAESKVTRLGSPYVSVNGSFGGNQGWFEKLDNKKKATRLADFGCGLIGVGDILLYITGGKVMDENSKQVTGISSSAYNDYILSIEKKYFHVLPKLGISGPLLAWGMNLYFLIHKKKIREATGAKYHARWFVRKKNILKRAKEMLSNDIPVLFSVGPGFFKKEKINLYTRAEHDGKPVFKQTSRTKDHYMIITGVLEGEKTMLEISSWGSKYYISFNEYLHYIKKNDNSFFSNILYIKKKTYKG
ncbi:MAG: hypothetical protein K5865_00695 [Eubacterium sp.]|nr:hypothetical protein [Eubacterium sp.]MCR4845242.1 hypothetical protein [Eubacterium sp.]